MQQQFESINENFGRHLYEHHFKLNGIAISVQKVTCIIFFEEQAFTLNCILL